VDTELVTATTSSVGGRRGRTSEDFLMFCKMILDYENYEETRGDSLRRRHASSPLGSTGSGDGVRSGEEEEESPRTAADRRSDVDTDDDQDQVTCYCRKPFGGRPMIECSSCLTWVHISCAKVKRTAIPDTWHCAMCKTKSTKSRRNSQAKSRRRKLPPSSQAKMDRKSSSPDITMADGDSEDKSEPLQKRKSY